MKESLKDCKQCDCCYCEMFGQGNVYTLSIFWLICWNRFFISNFVQNRLGREDFPQIRERLRLKLKNKVISWIFSLFMCYIRYVFIDLNFLNIFYTMYLMLDSYLSSIHKIYCMAHQLIYRALFQLILKLQNTIIFNIRGLSDSLLKNLF